MGERESTSQGDGAVTRNVVGSYPPIQHCVSAPAISPLQFWMSMLAQLFPIGYSSPAKRFRVSTQICTTHRLLCDVYTGSTLGPMIMGMMVCVHDDRTPAQFLFHGHDSNNYLPYHTFSTKFGVDRGMEPCSIKPTGFFAPYTVVGLVYIRITTPIRKTTSLTGRMGDFAGVFWLPFIIIDMPPINSAGARFSAYITSDFLMYPTIQVTEGLPTPSPYSHRLEEIDFVLPLPYLWKSGVVWGYNETTSGSLVYADGMCTRGTDYRRTLPPSLTVITSTRDMLTLAHQHHTTRLG